nr:unnamed protein product [Spirometra erinaceieuropaei]
MKTGSPVSRQISPVYVAGPRNSFTDTMRIHFVGQRDRFENVNLDGDFIHPQSGSPPASLLNQLHSRNGSEA